MTGLVLKDFFVMRKTLKTYVIFLAFYLAMAAVGMLDLSFVIPMIEIIIMMLPISAFAYDEQAKWDRYALCLPLGRRAMTGARYLFTLLIVLTVAAFGLLSCVLLSLTGPNALAESLASVLVSMGVGLFLADVMLPLNYKLGPERARPYFYAILFLPMIALFGVYKLGLLNGVDLSWLDRLPTSGALGVFALVPLAGLAGLGISFLISCRVVEQKEF